MSKEYYRGLCKLRMKFAIDKSLYWSKKFQYENYGYFETTFWNNVISYWRRKLEECSEPEIEKKSK